MTGLNGVLFTFTGSQEADFIKTTKLLGQKDATLAVCYSLHLPLSKESHIRYTIAHPVMVDSEGNRSNGYSRTATLSRVLGLDTDLERWNFVFEHDWEIVEGNWDLEISVDGSTLHTSQFEVFIE